MTQDLFRILTGMAMIIAGLLWLFRVPQPDPNAPEDVEAAREHEAELRKRRREGGILFIFFGFMQIASSFIHFT